MTAGTRILGIDTSLRSTGIGVIESATGGWRALEHTTVRAGASASHSECLRLLHEELGRILSRARPAAAAMEGGFFLKNARTAMILGEARGVVIASCAAAGVPVYEYSPRKVKQALVGTGTATKEQVARMVVARLGLASAVGEDESDALAIAICHAQNRTGYAALDARPL